jgi:hypothetical protein
MAPAPATQRRTLDEQDVGAGADSITKGERPVKIRTVEYRRLRSFGNYENESIGATMDVPEGGDPVEALRALEGWVNVQMAKAADREYLAREGREKREDAERELRAVQADIEHARAQYKRIQDFAAKFGVELEDIPF